MDMNAPQRRPWRQVVLGGMLLALAGTALSAGDIGLTEEERKFLRENEPIVFVSQTGYPPFEFVDANQQRRGMMVELAQWIATEAGFHAQFTDTVFQQAQQRLLSGDADVLTSFFFSEARDREFDFTQTVFLVPASIFVAAQRPDIALVSDLDGRRVATQRGDYAKEYLASLDIELELIQTDDFASAARAVIDGDADAMVGDEQIVLYYLYSSGLHELMKRVGEPLYVGLNAMAVVEGNHLLQSILNKGVEHARTSGTLDRLQEKWVGVELPGAGFHWHDYWHYGVGLALLVMWVVGWNVRLRHLVSRKTAQLELAASVFRHAREGIIMTDAQGAILDTNDAFTRITGYSRDEILGKNPRLLQSGHQGDAFYRQLWEDLLEQGAWEGELWNRRKNGEVFPELLTISKVSDKQGKTSHFVGIFTDISRQKEYERQLQSMAFYDSLTGLPNRALLADRLSQAMVSARRNGCKVSLAYIDLDGFKEINDRLGHEFGDRVLVTIAERLTHALREADTVARFGGDEFILVLPGQSDVASVSTLIAHLLGHIAEPIEIEGTCLYVSGSVGVVHFDPEDDIEPEQLIRQADQAMYQAKQAGKNRFHVFDAEHDRAVRGHHESLERIRDALANDEFVLHYQPKVNMSTGEVIGVEALIRWQHPQRGLLAPAAFLPAIQQHPLAIDLGEWVLARALGQFEAWVATGIRLPVSINIDAIHLQQADFVARLRAEVERHPSVMPGDLELEVLETNAFSDVAHVTSVMQACREFGVDFAIDDFGTGYSSLTYLRHLPASVLKVDQSFVRDMLDDPEDLTMLEGVLGLAVAFRREIVAEGVETLLHGRLLLAMGYQLGQGYAIARPMPADSIPGWRDTWRPDASWYQRQRAGPEELRAIYAMVDHRACAAGMLQYLSGERPDRPKANCTHCRLAQWLAPLGRDQGQEGPGMGRIARLHATYDRLAQEALILKEDEGHEGARQHTRQVAEVSEELQDQLQYWIDERGVPERGYSESSRES
ncbi:hypothetical protein Q427_24600 [Halomonas sp. BC04]|nr:hypothetical protein Q427_24600 [Halomonas sp. BC04]